MAAQSNPEAGPVENKPSKEDPKDEGTFNGEEPVEVNSPLKAAEGGAVEQQPQPAPDSACVHSLEGRVFEQLDDDLYGLEAAKVLLYSEDRGALVAESKTDIEGNYRIDRLCSGLYRVEIRANGFVAEAEVLAVPLAGGKSFVNWQLSETLVIDVLGESVEMPNVRSQETLSGKRLDDTRGLALAEALESINGVRVIEMGTISKPVIHGMHSNRVLIMYDDVRHESQSWGLDHAPEIDPFAASSLTVIKGAAGVRYGSNAIGGVILVKPPGLPRDPGVSGEANAVGISNGMGGAASMMLRGGSSWLDGLGWRLQGSTKKLGSVETPDYVLDNTAVEELNASAAVGVRTTNYGLELSGSLFSTTLGVFTGLVAENRNLFLEQLEQDRPLQVDLYEFDYEVERPFQEVSHTLVKGSSYFDHSEVGRFSLQVDWQRNDRQEYDIVRQSTQGPQLDFKLTTISGELLWEFDHSTWLLGGLGIEGSEQENVFKGRRLIPNYRTYSGGAFGWLQVIAPKWEAEVGARIDSDFVDSFQADRVGGASADVEENTFSYVTPSFVVGALARPAEDLEVKLSLSSASRAPTINELFIDGVSQGIAAFELGDNELDTEQTYGASFDLAWEPAKWLEINTNVYTQLIGRYIYLAPELDDAGEPVVTATVNGGFPSLQWQQVDALFYGIDAEVGLTPLYWLEFRSRVSLVRARDVENDAFLIFIPADFYEQELRFKAPQFGPLVDNYLSATYSYVDRQDRVDLNADFTDPPDAHHLLGAGLGTAWQFEKKYRLQFDLDAKNILNTTYRSYLSRLRYFADEPGRTVIARLKASF